MDRINYLSNLTILRPFNMCSLEELKWRVVVSLFFLISDILNVILIQFNETLSFTGMKYQRLNNNNICYYYYYIVPYIRWCSSSCLSANFAFNKLWFKLINVPRVIEWVCLWYIVCLANLVEVPTLAACMRVRAEDHGSTPGADKLDTGSRLVNCEVN